MHEPTVKEHKVVSYLIQIVTGGRKSDRDLHGGPAGTCPGEGSGMKPARSFHTGFLLLQVITSL